MMLTYLEMFQVAVDRPCIALSLARPSRVRIVRGPFVRRRARRAGERKIDLQDDRRRA